MKFTKKKINRCLYIQKNQLSTCLDSMSHVHVLLKSAFSFFFFKPAFVDIFTVNSAPIHCSQTYKLHFSTTFSIKNGSYGIIHTFKNYFVIMFSVSVFRFSTNKLNPNSALKKKKIKFSRLML